MKTRILTYKGKDYVIKLVEIDGELFPVSTTDFEDALCNETGDIIGDLELALDDQVYCYVEQDRFDDEDTLAAYVKEYFF